MARWTVEGVERIEAAMLAPMLKEVEGCLDGRMFVVRRGEKELARGTLYPTCATFQYSVRMRSFDPWSSVSGNVSFTWTRPNFGGRRLWLVCPRCGRRVRAVFMSTTMACRHCLGLRYRLQQASRIDRGWGMRDRICDRLGGDPMNPVKPKRMHWTTYQKLVQRMNDRAASLSYALAKRLRLLDDRAQRIMDRVSGSN